MGPAPWRAEPGFRGIESSVPLRLTTREQVAKILGSWHLSVPSETDVELLTRALNAPDGTLPPTEAAAVLCALESARMFRRMLLEAIAELSAPCPPTNRPSLT